MSKVTGRRREDVRFGELPQDLLPGDYWKYLDRSTGDPMTAQDAPENLTGGVWGFYAPNGCGIGLLMKHTVREHDDRTISIRPGDGSSNSVKIETGLNGPSWHGYVDHGVWDDV